ncbi:MAG: putative Ig domain-containing protein [Pseudomonadota bacterium]
MNTLVHWAPIRNTTTTILAGALLSGCLSAEKESERPQEPEPTEIVVSGSVGDGPVVGADIDVFDNAGNLIAELQSDASAAYNISLTTARDNFPLILEATGGTDLVTNSSPDFMLRGAAFDTGSAESVANLSPFSTIAVELSSHMPGGSTSTNLVAAQDIVSTALNSGLDSLAGTSAMNVEIDATNITEMVKASETLSEIVRRTRDLLQGAGFSVNADSVVYAIAADLTDGVVDGIGANNTDARTAAVMTLVTAQVLAESMANELQVNGASATTAMSSAIDQVLSGPPSRTLDQLPATADMIAKARIGLAAAFAVNEDPAIRQLHTVISDIQAGQTASTIRVALPSGYRSILSTVLASIAGADAATIDLVNAIARTNGDLAPDNLAPTIQGTPATSVQVGGAYTFTPTASDPDGDVLTFSVSGAPSWTNFNSSTGELSGTPAANDVGNYPNILISVSDGEFSASLAAFQITVNESNNAPQISGTPAASVTEGQAYSFTPTASDPDGDTLTFSISGLPSWASFNSSTGELSGTPVAADVGVYSSIIITVSDGQLSASLSEFAITVNAISLGSVTLDWTAPTLNEDGTTLTDLAGYNLYWGTSVGNYPNSVSIGNPSVTTYTVDNLSPGTYYFVATAINSADEESNYSGVATKIVP